MRSTRVDFCVARAPCELEISGSAPSASDACAPSFRGSILRGELDRAYVARVTCSRETTLSLLDIAPLDLPVRIARVSRFGRYRQTYADGVASLESAPCARTARSTLTASSVSRAREAVIAARLFARRLARVVALVRHRRGVILVSGDGIVRRRQRLRRKRVRSRVRRTRVRALHQRVPTLGR